MPNTKRWQCTVCGYVQEGPTPPNLCPKCGVKSDKFIALKKR
jgi:rubrerythrin